MTDKEINTDEYFVEITDIGGGTIGYAVPFPEELLSEIMKQNKQLKRKRQECEELKKGYAELTEIVSLYMDDFTGYNENLGGFDLILCVKELLQQLTHKTQECEELKEYIQANKATGICETCTHTALIENDRYRKALEEIEIYCKTAKGVATNKNDIEFFQMIVDIINKAKGRAR